MYGIESALADVVQKPVVQSWPSTDHAAAAPLSTPHRQRRSCAREPLSDAAHGQPTTPSGLPECSIRGFPYTPVLSIATCVHPDGFSHSDIACNSGRCRPLLPQRFLASRPQQTGHDHLLVNVQSTATLIPGSHGEFPFLC